MSETRFATSTGRSVRLDQLRIRTSTLGYLEGTPERIRHEVLKGIPDEVRGFGWTGLLLHEPPPGPLPMYTYFLALHSEVPLSAENSFSSLVSVWFADSLPRALESELADHVQRIDWDKRAVDGNW